MSRQTGAACLATTLSNCLGVTVRARPLYAAPPPLLVLLLRLKLPYPPPPLLLLRALAYALPPPPLLLPLLLPLPPALPSAGSCQMSLSSPVRAGPTAARLAHWTCRQARAGMRHAWRGMSPPSPPLRSAQSSPPVSSCQPASAQLTSWPGSGTSSPRTSCGTQLRHCRMLFMKQVLPRLCRPTQPSGMLLPLPLGAPASDASCRRASNRELPDSCRPATAVACPGLRPADAAGTGDCSSSESLREADMADTSESDDSAGRGTARRPGAPTAAGGPGLRLLLWMAAAAVAAARRAACAAGVLAPLSEGDAGTLCSRRWRASDVAVLLLLRCHVSREEGGLGRWTAS